MEDNERRQKPQVDVSEMHRKKTCADCQYFDLAGGWEICKLFEVQTKGVICNSFFERTQHDNTW